jgi:hypothetical protein
VNADSSASPLDVKVVNTDSSASPLDVRKSYAFPGGLKK